MKWKLRFPWLVVLALLPRGEEKDFLLELLRELLLELPPPLLLPLALMVT